MSLTLPYISLLQTYGIVQPGGETEFTTFVLAVEDDGPAYMAGLRPGIVTAYSLLCKSCIFISLSKPYVVTRE